MNLVQKYYNGHGKTHSIEDVTVVNKLVNKYTPKNIVAPDKFENKDIYKNIQGNSTYSSHCYIFLLIIISQALN